MLLVAVTKTHPADIINEAIDAGATDIGENKAQEIMDKYDQVKPVRWHMIGHLQTNKVKYIIDKVDMIHSVDSLKLAKEINKRAANHDKIMDVLVQVNSAQEESKFGVTSEETGERWPGIRVSSSPGEAVVTAEIPQAASSSSTVIPCSTAASSEFPPA